MPTLRKKTPHPSTDLLLGDQVSAFFPRTRNTAVKKKLPFRVGYTRLRADSRLQRCQFISVWCIYPSRILIFPRQTKASGPNCLPQGSLRVAGRIIVTPSIPNYRAHWMHSPSYTRTFRLSSACKPKGQII